MRKKVIAIVLFFCYLGFSCDSEDDSTESNQTIVTILAKNTDNTPVSQLHLVVSYTDENGNQDSVDFGLTDSNGKAVSIIPSNQEVILSAYHLSNVLILNQTIQAINSPEKTITIIVPMID